MKQLIKLSLAALACSLVFTNCAKEIESLVPETPAAGEFEIIASAPTKTTNDGLSTKWAANDGINLFHAEAGTSVSTSDGKFSIASADLEAGTFKGTLGAALSAASYDWYAFYPYSSYITTPANTDVYSYIGCKSNETQTQTGVNSMAHLAGSNYPLYGKVTGVSAADVPSITMTPAFCVVEIAVKNSTDAALSVSSIEFTAPENIVGAFYINFSGVAATYTDHKSYIAKTAKLTVTGASIAVGETAKFYLAVKTFTATSGSELSIAVNGNTKKLTLTKDVTFPEGRIKQLSFDYKKAADYVTLDWDYAGGTAKDLNAIAGVTTSGLGTDYDKHAPYCVKFDNTGDYIQIKTDSSIGTVSVSYKMIGGNTTSKLNIFESADGSTWSSSAIESLTISGAQNSTGTLTTTADFNSSSRYVKIVFEKGSNVGIGAISIHKPDTTPQIIASAINNVPAAGETDAEWTYTVRNFTDDVEVGSVTGCVTEAIADGGDIVYSVEPNYTTTAKTGTIVLWSAADHSITTTINVAQLKSTLSVNKTEVTIPADATTATFTVTSEEFGYTAVASPATGMNLSITGGASGSASASAQTVTLSSTVAAPTSGDPVVLGTILVYRNGNSSDSQRKEITVKKDVAGASGETTKEVTISDLGWSNGTQHTSLDIDKNVSVTLEGGDNTGKYYTSGANWRLYQGESATMTITAKTGYTLKSVSITFTNDNSGTLVYSGSAIASNSVVTLSGSSATFSVGNSGTKTNGQIRITKIKVVYTAE